MRALTIAAFVLDGIAAVGFIGMMAFGDGQMTPLDGFVLSALLLGFFSALGSILIAVPDSRPVTIHASAFPERRRIDRRIIDLGSPTGLERRSGRDRRVIDLTLGGILAPRPALSDYNARS